MNAEIFNLSATEIRILRIWADTVMHGGHWGDGAVVLPDEADALARLDAAAAGEPPALSARHFFTFLVWSGASTETPEEILLRERLEAALIARGGRLPEHRFFIE